MGVPIFLNLVAHTASSGLPPPCAWNVDQSRYEELGSALGDKGMLCEELEDVVKRSNVVFTCLLNDTVAESVYKRMFSYVGKDKIIFVDQSSLKPKTSSTCLAAAHTLTIK